MHTRASRLLSSRLLSVVDQNLGRCPRCTKIAFLFALVSWVALLIVQQLWPDTVAAQLTIAIAGGLTTLWLLHFFAYTGRVLNALYSEYVRGRPLLARADGKHDVGRRNLFWVFGNAVALGMVASVWLPNAAFALGSPCRPGRSCPDHAPKCCSRSSGICCDGNWHCNSKCFNSHADARKYCGTKATISACS